MVCAPEIRANPCQTNQLKNTFINHNYRLFFVVSFILVVCLSGYFITNVYMKWISTPIIISLNPQLSQSKDFPFPAVTICNMNQAKESFAKSISKDSLEYSVLTSLCYHTKFNSTFNDNVFGKWSFVRRLIVNVSEFLWWLNINLYLTKNYLKDISTMQSFTDFLSFFWETNWLWWHFQKYFDWWGAVLYI